MLSSLLNPSADFKPRVRLGPQQPRMGAFQQHHGDPRARRRSRQFYLFAAVLGIFLFWWYYLSDGGGVGNGKGGISRIKLRGQHGMPPGAGSDWVPSFGQPVDPPHRSSHNKVELVVASVKNTSTHWLKEFFPHYAKSIYVSDDPEAKLTVPMNKGRESTVYLTYIIDNYDTLPEVMIFLHGSRYQWHNEDPMYDGVPMLQNFRIPYVRDHQFATLRCTWELGCPHEMSPDLAAVSRLTDPDADDRAKTEAAYAKAFTELFPDLQLPDDVAVHCGAQFAVTREAVKRRPKRDYVRYRQWLWETDLPQQYSGRVFEYAWHIMMGMPSKYCPDARDCFCQKFGLCNLEGCVEHGCPKRYKFKFGLLPKDWPDVGPGEDGWPEKGWAD
ncbi:MAG: hypothetical protein M1831_002913 [Alyxoria varia]|nr:MAG: hypothetical protein M1831_002913 [Alyxoria varia]